MIGKRFVHFCRRWLSRFLRRFAPLFRRATTAETSTATTLGALDGVLRGTFSGRICQRSLFAREYPASLEGPLEGWDLATIVIDHGCCLFSKLNSHRSELGLRDPVVMALFRRILITAEAVRTLLSRGLEEPAFATARTLLELERDLRLVIADVSDTRARRVAAFLPVKGRRNFAKATKDSDTRDLLQRNRDFFDWLRKRSRSFRVWTDSEAFRDVAEDLARHDHWHGFVSQQEAFDKAGMATKYHLEYGGSSLFVHGSNVEHDFADADDESIRLKAFAQRDPNETLPPLGRLTLALIDIYRLIWEDRGKPKYQESVTFEDEDGQTYDMDALDALTARAISIFPNPAASAST